MLELLHPFRVRGDAFRKRLKLSLYSFTQPRAYYDGGTKKNIKKTLMRLLF